MATKPFYVDIDLGLNEFLNARIQNLTTTNRTSLGGTLTSNDKGVLVYDTDLSKVFVWTGSAWFDISQTITNPLTLKGEIDASTNPAFPASPSVGDVWIITVAGTVGGETVEVGDQLIYSTSGWFILQTNIGQASETVAGYIRLATQAEVTTGTNDLTAVTPLKLATDLNVTTPRVKRYTTTVSLTANVASTITHNLNLGNQNACIVACYVSNQEAVFDINTTSVNALTVTSKKTVANVFVVVQGI